MSFIEMEILFHFLRSQLNGWFVEMEILLHILILQLNG